MRSILEKQRMFSNKIFKKQIKEMFKKQFVILLENCKQIMRFKKTIEARKLNEEM